MPIIINKRRINMKLFIIRDQAKGLLGGVKFELRARVDLTNEEAELVKKYKAGKEILLKKEVKIPFTGRALVFDLKIDSLPAGQNFKCNDIADIIEYEKNVKESCEAFKNYLEVMRNFGGEEVIEF
jgi:hypothetical protein